MKKQILIIFFGLIVLFVTGCNIQNVFETNFTITEIKGIGQEYKIYSGTGLCRGNLTEYDSAGNLRCYSLCKLDDFKVTKTVKDNIGGTDYLFIHYEISSTLLSGEFDEEYGGSCMYTVEVYDKDGNQLQGANTNSIPKVKNMEFNVSNSSSGVLQYVMNGDTYSITVSGW